MLFNFFDIFSKKTYNSKLNFLANNLFKSFEKFYKLMLDKLSDEMCLKSFIYFCEEILAWQKSGRTQCKK